MSLLVFLFGGGIFGGILEPLTWSMALTAIGFVLLFRPLAGRLSLAGVQMSRKDKWATSFFGIKGIGSFFYLAFALDKHDFTHQEKLWAFVSFVVLTSILVHGLSAIWAMKRLKGASE